MSKNACCRLADHLGAEPLARLNRELHRDGHQSFRKLAAEYDVSHVAIKRHKDTCLGLRRDPGEPAELPGEPGPKVRHTPRAEQERKLKEGPVTERVTGGVTPVTPVTDGLEPPRARKFIIANTPKTHEEKVMAIVTRIADGTWNGQIDVPYFAREWGCSADALRHLVREAFMVAAVDRGDVDTRRQVAMGKWDVQLGLVDEAIRRGPDFPDTMSKLLTERARAIDGWCKAAGVFDDATKVQINIFQMPQFQEATAKIFDTFHGALDATALAMALPDVDRSTIERMLHVVRTSFQQRMAALSEAPQLVEST